MSSPEASVQGLGELISRYRGIVEMVDRLEEDAWRRRGVSSSRALLAALLAYRLGVAEGLDAEALFVASLVKEAARIIERRTGRLCSARHRSLLVEFLRKAGYPEALIGRVEAVLGSERGSRVLADAGSLAKLTLPGFTAMIASRLERGRDLFAALLEASSRELTAINYLDCLLGLESSRSMGRRLASRVKAYIEDMVAQLEELGLSIRVDRLGSEGSGLVVIEPRRCPRCGSSLERSEDRNPWCGGLSRSYHCPRCGWGMSVTVCPPPPCRGEA